MAVRNIARDSRGRFAPKGGGVVSRAKQPRPQPTGGSMTRMLRRGQRDLYKAEQERAQGLMQISGGGSVAGMRLIRGSIRRGAQQRIAASAKQPSATGKVSDAIRGTLRQLAQSDARYFRELGNIVGTAGTAKPKLRGSQKPKQRKLKGG